MALTRPKYSQIYDTDWKQSAKLATTADVGDLYTSNAQPNSVDGISVAINDRILVKDQGNSMQNGLYFVRTVGTGANGWWTRTLDANQDAFVTSGLTVEINSGSTNAGKTYKIITTDPIYLGNTGLTFQVSTAASGGANTQIQFNDNNALNGSAYFTYNKYSNVLTVGGNITASGKYITAGYFLGNGSQLTGLPNSYSNVQVATYLQTGNIANVSVAGNITATYFLGNGSLLSGISSSYSNINLLSTLTSGVAGNILPSANLTYDLGTPTLRWRTGYFSANTIDLGGSQIGVTAAGFTFNTSGNTTTISTNSAAGNMYLDKTNGWIGFNDTTPDFVFDFYTPDNAGEILHIEGGVGTQAYFGARNSSGLNYAAGVDQYYAFSGTKDTINDYALITNGIVRANIQGNTGNVIFTKSITVANDVITKYLGVQEFRATASNIFVRSAMTFAGTNLYGMGKVAIGTENPGVEVFTVLGGSAYFDRDVTITGNLFVNGNTTTFTSNNITLRDSIIYLSDNNPADTVDIGFVGSFNNVIRYQHTGFVRDATDGVWKLFSNVVPEPTTTIDFTNAVYANLLVGNVSATYFTGNGALLTGIASGGFAGNTSIYVSGTVTAINNGGTNGVGNIGATGATFNTIFAKSTTAQYADLAEVYTSDKNYVPSTVLIFGGDREVTISTISHDPRIAGVVSTNPAYLMNDTETGVAVALTGRVPCQVLGPVAKGDRLVASQWPGIAQRLNPDLYEPGCVIGKALETITESSVKTIEVVVGRV